MNETDSTTDVSKFFFFGKNGQNAKMCGIKSDLSVSNDDFQRQGTDRKLLFLVGALKVYLV